MSCAGSGLQLPRLSSTQRLALSVGVNDAGLQVFDTTLQSAMIWTGTVWTTSVASFTTAQLLALSASESAALGIAYCTDCLSTKGILTDVGDFVFWNGDEWITATDTVVPVTVFGKFCLSLQRRNFNSNVIPGSTYWATLAAGNANVGTSAAITSATSTTTNGQINQLIASTGTTATGIASFRYNGFDKDPTNWNSRAIAYVTNHVTVDDSVVGQTFSYRTGISTYSATAIGTLGLDEACLVYDPNNTFGAGINTDNWWYLIRANGTTLFTGDTGIPRTTPLWIVCTMVPVSGDSVIVTISTALNDGSAYTVHATQTVTFSTSPASCVLCMAKTTGVTAKTATRQHNPKMFAVRTNTLTPTTVVY